MYKVFSDIEVPNEFFLCDPKGVILAPSGDYTDIKEEYSISDLITMGIFQIHYRSKSKNKAIAQYKMLQLLN